MLLWCDWRDDGPIPAQRRQNIVHAVEPELDPVYERAVAQCEVELHYGPVMHHRRLHQSGHSATINGICCILLISTQHVGLGAPDRSFARLCMHAAPVIQTQREGAPFPFLKRLIAVCLPLLLSVCLPLLLSVFPLFLVPCIKCFARLLKIGLHAGKSEIGVRRRAGLHCSRDLTIGLRVHTSTRWWKYSSQSHASSLRLSISSAAQSTKHSCRLSLS